MKKRVLIFLLVYFGKGIALLAQTLPLQDQVIQIMRKVGDFQIAQPWPLHLLKQNLYATGPKSWVAGAYYPGIVDLYQVTNEAKYLDYLLDVGKNNQWEQGSRLRAADDQAIQQTYLELYDIKKDPAMLAAAKNTLDETMKAPRKGYEEWDWSDTLFMTPPIWPHYAAISDNPVYLDFMDKMWWEAADSLYSKRDSLFFRDHRFKTMQSRNGEPVFWLRGNGWVAGSLVKILEFMPADYLSRPRYEQIMNEFAGKLKNIQSPDGFWKSSLLDPDEFPHVETSGTALFCYMLAWGINNQILESSTYLPVVVRAWNALTSAVHQDGKLGYGWHDAPDTAEQMPVCIAQHPISNIGRSHHDGKQPEPKDFKSKEGLYFKEQWKREESRNM